MVLSPCLRLACAAALAVAFTPASAQNAGADLSGPQNNSAAIPSAPDNAATAPAMPDNAAATQPAEAGFFKPRPDHSLDLHAPDPVPVGGPPASPPAGRVTAQPVAQPAPAMNAQVQPAPTPAERVLVQQWTQEELERQAQRDQQVAQQQLNRGPTPINGAFTGLTSERDR